LKLRLITGVLFFSRQIKLQSVRYARVPGVLFFWRALSGQAFGFIFFATTSAGEVPFPQKRIPPQSFTQTLLKFNPFLPNELHQKNLANFAVKNLILQQQHTTEFNEKHTYCSIRFSR
jgi:hypothetical protein